MPLFLSAQEAVSVALDIALLLPLFLIVLPLAAGQANFYLNARSFSINTKGYYCQPFLLRSRNELLYLMLIQQELARAAGIILGFAVLRLPGRNQGIR